MRVRALLLGLAIAGGTLGVASADPYPVLDQPVLKSDSQFVATPWGYQHKALTLPVSGNWPTMFSMEGYSGASRPMPNAYLRMDDGELIALLIKFGQGPTGAYASVQASTRGTECSGGSFNLYDRRHAWDGHHIVEWIAEQPWSNEKVGMFGSSFPGQTAYWVATTQPPHLTAVSANLLHSDIYRDIFMPGGVQNYLFPIAWTYAAGPHRLPQDSAQRGMAQNDEICTQSNATRYNAGDLPQAQNEPLLAAVRSVDDDWYTSHAAITYAPSIKIPYYQQTNWQDEQVGPRSVVLFNHINPTPRTITGKDGQPRTVVPKKFVTSNGDHGYGNFAGNQRWAWFDIWLRDMPDTTGLLDSQFTNYFETDNNGNAVATKSGDSWPFADTTYPRSYFHANGALDSNTPTSAEAPDTYVSGVARQNWFDYAPDNFGSDVATASGYPDELRYLSAPLTDTMTVAGPILMDLYASIAGTDADFYVSISDVFPNGNVSFLQRGLLKASHRAVDKRRSYYAADGRLVQPYRPHTNPQPVTPGEVIKYDLEIFPLGYIFRPGHKILIQIHTPPILEKLWGYTPTHHQPAPVTVHHSAQYPTSIQWPLVTTDKPIPPSTTACPLQGGFFCAPPSVLNR